MQSQSPIPICGISRDLLPQFHCWLWAKDVIQQHCDYTVYYFVDIAARPALADNGDGLISLFFPVISVLMWTSFRLAFRCHFGLFHGCCSLYDSWQFYCLRQGSYFFAAVFICQQDYSKSTEPIYPELSGLMGHGSVRTIYFGAHPG